MATQSEAQEIINLIWRYNDTAERKQKREMIKMLKYWIEQLRK